MQFPQYNQDFLLCLSLDSAPTWSISNSGPVLTVVSLLCGHLDEGIRGSLLKSYVWTTPSSLPGKPGFDSWDAASSSCLRLSLLREVSRRRLIFGSFLPTWCYPEMSTGIGTPHALVSVRVCCFAILLCFCLAKVQEREMQGHPLQGLDFELPLKAGLFRMLLVGFHNALLFVFHRTSRINLSELLPPCAWMRHEFFVCCLKTCLRKTWSNLCLSTTASFFIIWLLTF